MRPTSSSLVLVLTALLVGCGSDGDTDVNTTSPGGAAGTGGASTGGQSGKAGMSGTSGGETNRVCTPGSTQTCVGVGACEGGQACRDDGSGWGPCQCAPNVGGAGGQGAGTGGSAGTETGAGQSGGGGISGTGGSGEGGAGTGGAGTGGQGGSAGTSGASGAAGSGGNTPIGPWVTTADIKPNGWPSSGNGGPGPMAVDKAGNVLILGNARGAFDGGKIDTGKNAYAIVMKLDPSGKRLWERAISGTSVTGLDIAVDASGNPVVVGYFQGNIDVGKGSVNAAGADDMFAIKMSAADGATQWGRTWGDVNYDLLNSVSVSPIDGDTVLVGSMSGAVDFGKGPLVGTSQGYTMVELHLDAAGQTTASRAYGGLPGTYLKVRHKPDGNFLVAGSFRDTATFGTGGKPQTTPGSSSNLFLAEITPTGASVRTTRFVGSNEGGNGDIYAMVATPDGGIVIGGTLSGPTDFGSGTAAGGAFVAAFDAEQKWRWDHTAFGGYGQAFTSLRVNDLAVTPAGDTLAIGTFNGTYNLGDGPITAPPSGLSYLTRFGSTGIYQKSSTYENASFVSTAVALDGAPLVTATYSTGADLGSGPLADYGWAIAKMP